VSNDELLAAILEAEKHLLAMPPWKRRWLEFKWLRIDPVLCRVRCWFTGEECPWGGPR
jgi:hypothetical protein